MSTKSTIKYGDKFHLYTDWLDECAGDDLVHLRLEDVSFEASTDQNGTSITVSIPFALAVQLGLVPPKSVQDAESDPGA